jgi:hypothetical protein
LVLYDARGEFDRNFDWWKEAGKHRLVEPQLPFENGRSDLLTGSGSRLDIQNINLLAGALQDNKRAAVVGTRSFGMGTIQTTFPLGAGRGALRISTARYFTPSGRSIQAKGIEPDIEVLQDVTGSHFPLNPKEDKALHMAVDLLRGVRKNPVFPPSPKTSAPN